MCIVKVLNAPRGGFRVRVTDTETKKYFDRYFASQAEAEEAAPKLRREYSRPVGVALFKAIAEYKQFQTAKGNRPRSISVTIERITAALAGLKDSTVTGDITKSAAEKSFNAYATSPGPIKGKPPSVNTQIGTLTETKSFFRWCAKKGWMREDENPLSDVVVMGKRKKGKAQFVGIDESRRFLAKAFELARNGDVGAAAAATALLMGMRGSEIADRLVRELDDGGRLFVITKAKTDAGIRRIRIPEMLQPLLVSLCKDRDGSAKIFGEEATRHWVRYAVRRVCKAAGVSLLCPHGLRGTHASLAVESGMSGLAVAGSIGQSGTNVLFGHYATPESRSGASVDSVSAALSN